MPIQSFIIKQTYIAAHQSEETLSNEQMNTAYKRLFKIFAKNLTSFILEYTYI